MEKKLKELNPLLFYYSRDRFSKLLKVASESELEQMISTSHTKTKKELYKFASALFVKYEKEIDRVVLTQNDIKVNKWIESLTDFEVKEYMSGRKPYPEWVFEP